MPYLAPAIGRFLQEYPWARDGLSRSERRLLELAADGITLRDAFPRMQDGETADYITDTSIAELAEDLSRTSPALLSFTAEKGMNSPGLHGSVALTDAGRAVLAGEKDRFALCGIDRWLGGVHLQGTANVWRWDAEGQRMDRR